MDWKRAIKEFNNYLSIERGLSANSVKAYVRDIQWLHLFAEKQNLLPVKLKTSDLEACIQSRHEGGTSHRSLARMISSWRSFFGYLVLEDLIEEDPSQLLEMPKLGRYLPDVLSLDEIESMCAQIQMNKPEGHRDRAIIETLYACGLRVSELTGLEMNNLYMEEFFLRVTGKGNKQRLVPLHDEVCHYLKIYIEEVRVHFPIQSKAKHLVFLNQRGGSLSRVSVFKLVKRLAEQAGIQKNVSPHTFRHSFATHLVQNGADLRVVQELLGHESILTTEIYTHLDGAHLREAILKFHPRN
jgi:integrase/recombinase XerD